MKCRAGESSTLGHDGALALIENTAYHLQPPKIKTVSATGSGDAFVGMLTLKLSTGHSPLDSLQWATAAGTANALSWEPCGCRLNEIQKIFPQVHIKIIS
jgi:fructose-1-phosphate kinase PfkB-like protein